MPRRTRITLGLLLVLLSGFQGSAQPRHPPGFVGSFVWNQRDEAFGGFSAIEVGPDGRSFVAISDKATFVIGQLDRDASGEITGVRMESFRPLLGGSSGQPLTGRRADSEGLAITPSGEAFVSFENRSRVARVDLTTGRIRDLDNSPDFAALPKNGALEALAAADGPVLYAIPEEPPTADIPVYRRIKGEWDSTFSLPRRGRPVPVAADIGPDGRLYLLERDFRGIGGFSSRLRRFDISEAGFTGEITLFETPFALHDNLEGLSVWRDDSGSLRATMISDDNFFALQQTQIVEYRLPD